MTRLRLGSLGGLKSGFRCFAGNSLGFYQIANLEQGNERKNSGAHSKGKSEYGDGIGFRSTPKGFLWVLLAGYGIGVLLGAVLCVAIWLVEH